MSNRSETISWSESDDRGPEMSPTVRFSTCFQEAGLAIRRRWEPGDLLAGDDPVHLTPPQTPNQRCEFKSNPIPGTRARFSPIVMEKRTSRFVLFHRNREHSPCL